VGYDKKLIIVFIVLLITISLVGTIAVVSEYRDLINKKVTEMQHPVTNGKVVVRVEEPQYYSSSGKVKLNVKG